jgi:hypothetical protein
MSGPRGIHLSGTQIIASVLATLTGAIAASYLGVGGTLVGAALGSIASTTGTEIYRHYLMRSQERIKAAGEVLYHRTTAAHTVTQHQGAQPDAATQPNGAGQGNEGQIAAGGRHAVHQGRPGQETVTWRRQYPNGTPDAAEPQRIPEPTALRQNGHTGRWEGPGQTASTRAGGQVGDGEPGSGGPAASSGQGSGHWWDGISRRQWLTYGGITLGAFVVVIAVITIFELSVGKPVDAVVWGKHATGTSVGNVVSGHSSPHKVTHPATTSTPSAQPSSSTPQSPNGSVAPSSPAPTPSTSASSSPTPTPTASGPASPGGGIHSIPPASPSP